ncbi:MAG TPA: hypothetical protein V6D17_23930 [Candidatus Obscuribacterales bacterium]
MSVQYADMPTVRSISSEFGFSRLYELRRRHQAFGYDTEQRMSQYSRSSDESMDSDRDAREDYEALEAVMSLLQEDDSIGDGASLIASAGFNGTCEIDIHISAETMMSICEETVKEMGCNFTQVGERQLACVSGDKSARAPLQFFINVEAGSLSQSKVSIMSLTELQGPLHGILVARKLMRLVRMVEDKAMKVFSGKP